eukprot:9502165-Pyramimonas_sp.AAC.1
MACIRRRHFPSKPARKRLASYNPNLGGQPPHELFRSHTLFQVACLWQNVLHNCSVLAASTLENELVGITLRACDDVLHQDGSGSRST